MGEETMPLLVEMGGAAESVAKVVEQHLEENAKQDLIVLKADFDAKSTMLSAMERIRWESKPVPVPEGHIAVQIPALAQEGYYIAKLDSGCKDCGGDGRNHEPSKPGDELRLNYCRACILDPVDLFTKEYNRRVRAAREAAEAEARAERADTDLAQRLNEAHLRVVDLEKQRDEALGQNKLDVESTKSTIEKCTTAEPEFVAKTDEHAKFFSASVKDFTNEVKEARKWYDAEKSKLDVELDGKLAEIEKRRQGFAAEYAKQAKEIVEAQKKNALTLSEAREKLRYYEAGPGKIAARFEEKLKKPRETLARLKKRYES